MDSEAARAERRSPFLRMCHRLNPDEETFASLIKKEKKEDQKKLREEFKEWTRLAAGERFKKIKPG